MLFMALGMQSSAKVTLSADFHHSSARAVSFIRRLSVGLLWSRRRRWVISPCVGCVWGPRSLLPPLTFSVPFIQIVTYWSDLSVLLMLRWKERNEALHAPLSWGSCWTVNTEWLFEQTSSDSFTVYDVQKMKLACVWMGTSRQPPLTLLCGLEWFHKRQYFHRPAFSFQGLNMRKWNDMDATETKMHCLSEHWISGGPELLLCRVTATPGASSPPVSSTVTLCWSPLLHSSFTEEGCWNWKQGF